MKIGEPVMCLKGARTKGPFYGLIQGFTNFGMYAAVKVKKTDGRIVCCLVHNLMPKWMYDEWMEWWGKNK